MSMRAMLRGSSESQVETSSAEQLALARRTDRLRRSGHAEEEAR